MDHVALLRRQFEAPALPPVEETDALVQGALKIAQAGGDVEAWLRAQTQDASLRDGHAKVGPAGT